MSSMPENEDRGREAGPDASVYEDHDRDGIVDDGLGNPAEAEESGSD